MTEREYLNATNLVRLRSAVDLLGAVIGRPTEDLPSKDVRAVSGPLCLLMDRLVAAVKGTVTE